MTLFRRSALLFLLAGTVVAGWASPALAHAGGLVATDARSRVVSLSPQVPGLSVTTIEDGAKLRLVNGTSAPVAVPPGGGPATPTVIPAGRTSMWPDTRTSPVGKTVAPGESQTWSLTLDVAGVPITVTGVLEGHKPPLFAPWWAATLALAVAVPVLCRRARRPDLLLAAAALTAMAASIAHVLGSTMEVASAPMLGTFVNAAGINLLAWPLILGGALAAVRGRPAGLLAACAGAALTAVFVLPDVTSFHRAVLPFAGPDTLERVLVLLALSCGAGTAVAGASVLRTLAAAEPTPTGDPA
ncbi:hypothetical protein ACQPZX_29685 [Actinoplanes sp. CA-142083]|uniref:hypothetical protein n=1 Tax=Actinoplanes sp. CA-142083 TaxID=3239903 RepID=UPI003D8AAD0C